MLLSQSWELNKQTAEGKQTADLPKNHNFSYLTTMYSINMAISASICKWLGQEDLLPLLHDLTTIIH